MPRKNLLTAEIDRLIQDYLGLNCRPRLYITSCLPLQTILTVGCHFETGSPTQREPRQQGDNYTKAR